MDFWESLKSPTPCRMQNAGRWGAESGVGIVRTPFQSGSRRVLHSGPGLRFSLPMQCDAGRRAEPRSEKTCDDRVSPIGFRPAGSSLDLADSGRSPLCDSTLAGNTDSTRIRARIICSRTPIRARIIPTETRDVVRCSSLAHGLPVSPPLLHPPPSGLGVGHERGGCLPGGVGKRANLGREPPPALVCWATHRACTDRDPMLPRHTGGSSAGAALSLPRTFRSVCFRRTFVGAGR